MPTTKKTRRERDFAVDEGHVPETPPGNVTSEEVISVDSQSQLSPPTPRASRQDVGTQVMLPYQPSVFAIETENEMVRQAVTLGGRWSTDPFARDTAEQQRLRMEFMKCWRGVGALTYTLSGNSVQPPPTDHLCVFLIHSVMPIFEFFDWMLVEG